VGQGAETDLRIKRKPFQQFGKEEIRHLFDESYQKLYGRTYPETPVEFVTFRVRASLPERSFHIPRLKNDVAPLEDCIKGKREAYSLIRRAYIPFTVYDRLRLFSGAVLNGPAIVEEKESTIIIGEDAAGTVDGYGFVWITINSDKTKSIK
jgi:N-methylhydantoinase A